jgi:hypothetical protein
MWVERDLCSACATIEELLAHGSGLSWMMVLVARVCEDLPLEVNRVDSGSSGFGRVVLDLAEGGDGEANDS